jgi:hypothetical protein
MEVGGQHYLFRGCLKTCQTSQATDHEMEHRHPDHGLTRLGSGLIIFGSSAVTAQPAERPLPDPTPRASLDTLDACGPPDNLQADLSSGPQGPHPRDALSTIGPSGPAAPPPGQLLPEALQQPLRPLAVWYLSRRDPHGQEAPEGLAAEVAWAAFARWVRVNAADPPGSVVLTAGLALLPALGGRCWPVAARTSPRTRAGLRAQVPSWRQSQTE